VPVVIAQGLGRFNLGTPGAIGVAAGNVYWHQGDGVLWSVPIGGGAPNIVDPNFWVTMMTGDSAGLYGPTGSAILEHRLP
jgi:hypothetical protein